MKVAAGSSAICITAPSDRFILTIKYNGTVDTPFSVIFTELASDGKIYSTVILHLAFVLQNNVTLVALPLGGWVPFKYTATNYFSISITGKLNID